MSGVRTHVGSALAGVRGGGRGWVLVAVASGWFFTLGLRFVVPAFIPQLRATFHVSNATAGAVVTVLWLTYAAMQFPAGLLVDRLGARAVLTASLLLSGGAILALGVAPGFALFVVATGAFGLASGLYGTSRGLALARTFRDNQGVAFGATLAAGSLGAASLPVLGTALVDALGWQGVLAALAPPFLLVAALAARFVPAGGEVERASVRESVGAVRSPVVGLAVVGATLMLFVFQGVTAFLPTYLHDVKGLPQSTAAALYGLLFVCGAGFQVGMGRAADRFGYPRVLLAIGGVSVLPLLALPVAAGLPVLMVVVVGVSLRLAVGPVNNAYVVGALPEATQGTAWGLLRTLFFAVGSLGSVAVGALADRGYFDGAFYALAALTAIATAVYYLLLRTTGESAG
ncbi:MAG: MFS transporter [Halobacteriaceae archaeon]